MNILLVLVDQLVPFPTGPYGDAVVQTPALVTGRHASALGCYDNASAPTSTASSASSSGRSSRPGRQRTRSWC